MPPANRPSAAVAAVALLACAVAVAVASCSSAGSTAKRAAPPATTRKTTPPPLPASMAALGDSITQAYDATPTKHLLADQPQLSWSTGYAGAGIVDSQYERLLAAGDSTLRSRGHVANFSVSGAMMVALYNEAARAVAMRAGYVTILMGANDLCTRTIAGMTPVRTFAAEFTSALAELQAVHGVHIFVASIPNLYYLWQLLHTDAGAEGIWGFGICQSMLSKKDTNTDREEVLAREREDNAALASACARFADCRFDNDAVFDYRFSAQEVSSFDYFHPSIAGQDELATVTWARSFWPKDP